VLLSSHYQSKGNIVTDDICRANIAVAPLFAAVDAMCFTRQKCLPWLFPIETESEHPNYLELMPACPTFLHQ
jgi:hypothetical protein